MVLVCAAVGYVSRHGRAATGVCHLAAHWLTCSTTQNFRPAFAGGVGQGLDAAVVAVMAAVEGDLGDALGLGGLGELLADRLRRP